MDGILVLMKKNVRITNALPIILSNGKRNVGMLIIAKIVIVNFYIPIRALKNVLCVQDAKNGIVQRHIHILELDFVLTKKNVQIWLVCVYIHQNAPNYYVRLELIVVISPANLIIHLSDQQDVIKQIHVRTLTVLVFTDQTGILVKRAITVKMNTVLKFIHPNASAIFRKKQQWQILTAKTKTRIEQQRSV
jgi:hypothetical protein